MIRVLHLISTLNYGGLEKRLMALLRQIPRERVAMDFLCKGKMKGLMAPEAEQRGARVYHCRFTPLHVGYARGLRKFLTDGNYDIVHNHLANFSGLPVWVAHKCHVRVVTSYVASNFISDRPSLRLPGIRQAYALYTHLSTGYAIRNSEIVTAVSRGALEALIPDYRDRPNCEVLYGGMPLNTLPTAKERLQLREELKLPADTKLVLHAGRFAPPKNHFGLLAIFKEVLKTLPEARLLLAGIGPLFDPVAKAVADQQLSERVLLLGNRDDVPRLMRCCDAMLLPSFNEGLPVVGIEALSARLPIVASDIPGIRDEVVRNGETGFIHPVNDISGMAGSVVRLLQDNDLAEKIGKAGRALAEGTFSIEAAARRYIDLYERCMTVKSGNLGNSSARNADGQKVHVTMKV